MALLAVPFLDELASGVAPASAPDLAHDLGLPASSAAGGIVTAFYGLALLETPILAWSERISARWFSAASLAVLAIATLGAALAYGPIAMALCLALYGPAAGCSLAVAEGVLVEAAGASRERTMARITLAASLGDLGVPAVLGALAWLGVGWRAAFVLAGGAALVVAALHATSRELDRPMPSDEDDEGESAGAPSVREALVVAFSSRALLGWSLAGTLVGLLDEVLVAFAAVHLAALGPALRAVALASWTLGGLVGLAWLERRIESLDPRRVLLALTAIAAAALGALAFWHGPVAAPLLLAVVGASSATFHPLVKARAYASLPGRPALVNALAAALVPLDALAPLVLGAIALQVGAPAVILVLALAPIGVGVIAWRR